MGRSEVRVFTDEEVNALSASPTSSAPRVFSDEEIQKIEQESADFDQPLVAGAAGAARGLTFGLSDVALTKSGLVEPETLRKLEEYNPTSSTVGEIAGVAAPLILSGGSGALAKSLQFAGKGVTSVSKLGAAVERGVAKGIAQEGEKTLAREILESGVSKAAGSAVEGAIYGGGQVISEAAIGEDPELNAEKVLTTLGLSTLFGAGVGGTFGAIQPAAPSILRNAQKFTSATFDRVNDLTGGALDSAAKTVANISSKFSGEDEAVLQDLLKKPFSKEGVEARRLATLPAKEAEERVLETSNSLNQQYAHMEDVDRIVNKTIRPMERESLLEPIPPRELEEIFNPGPKVKAELDDARRKFEFAEKQKIESTLAGQFIPKGKIVNSPVVFKETSPEAYVAARKRSSKAQFLTPYSPEELKSHRVFLSDEGVGYALSPDNDLIGVFNNSSRPGAGQEALIHGISNGAKTLDAIDGFLPKYYKKFGFVEKKRLTWDDKYAPKNWNYEKYGRPDIVFMEYPESLSRNADEIRRRFELARLNESLRPSSEAGRGKSSRNNSVDRGIGRGARSGLGEAASSETTRGARDTSESLISKTLSELQSRKAAYTSSKNYRHYQHRTKNILSDQSYAYHNRGWAKDPDVLDYTNEFASQIRPFLNQEEQISARDIFKAVQKLKSERNEVVASRKLKGAKVELLNEYNLAIEKLETALGDAVPEFKNAAEKLSAKETLERKLSFWGVSSKGISEKKIQNLLKRMDDPAVAKAAKTFQEYNELLGVDTGKLGQKIRDLLDSGVEDPVEQMTRIQNSAVNLRNRTKAAINTMRREPDIYAPNIARKLEIALESMDNRLDEAATPLQMFTAIDETKQAIDAFAKFGKMPTSQEESAIELLRGVRRSFKEHLENPGIYGPAAVAQQSVNSKLNRFYRAKEEFEKNFMAKGKDPAGNIVYKISPSKVNTYLRGVDSANNSVKDSVLSEYLNASKSLLDEIDEISLNTPEISQLVKSNPILSRGSAPNDMFTSQIEKLVMQASKKSDLKALKRREGFGLSPADVLTGAVSYAFGGPLGIGLIYGLKMLNNPANLVEGLAALERMTLGVNKRVQSSLNAFVKGSTVLAEKALPAGSADPTRMLAPLSISILGSTSFTGRKSKTVESRQESYNKRLEELSQLIANPALMTERLSQNLFAMGTVAPQMAEAMTQQSVQALQYIYDKAPKNPRVGLIGQRPWQPSDVELAKWERVVTTALDPLSVLKDLEKGTLTREGVDTLSVLYPKFFQEIQSQLISQISELNEELPYRKRLALSVFFGVPVDNVMRPDFVQLLQSNYSNDLTAEDQKKEMMPTYSPGKAGSTNFSESRETETERIIRK
jgi:hypothetical protein